jgi:hypothetical protein
MYDFRAADNFLYREARAAVRLEKVQPFLAQHMRMNVDGDLQ